MALVITISAPQMLLSTGLISLVLGIGIYLGFVWTQDLDIEYGRNGSRYVWIVYLIGTLVCVIVYSTSWLISSHDKFWEDDILKDYCDQRMESAGVRRPDMQTATSLIKGTIPESPRIRNTWSFCPSLLETSKYSWRSDLSRYFTHIAPTQYGSKRSFRCQW